MASAGAAPLGFETEHKVPRNRALSSAPPVLGSHRPLLSASELPGSRGDESPRAHEHLETFVPSKQEERRQSSMRAPHKTPPHEGRKVHFEDEGGGSAQQHALSWWSRSR